MKKAWFLFLFLLVLPLFSFALVYAPNIPKADAVPQTAAPKIEQTQNFNFKITSHMVQNSSGCIGNQGCYTYVTPSGNHSFSKALPWLEKDTSLWKNATTALHTYGVMETLILVPSASIVSAGATFFSVNTTEKTFGGTVHGYLYVSYDFTKTPPKESTNYKEATGIAASFNLIGLIASPTFPYFSTDGVAYLSTGGGLGTMSGTYPKVFLSSTSAGAGRFSVTFDWSDYGSATVLYGRFTFNGASYQGVMVKFPLNVAKIDPSVVQTKNAAGLTVTFNSNTTSGNLIVLVACIIDSTTTQGTATVADAQTNTYTSLSGSSSASATKSGTTNAMGMWIWYATASAATTDAITITYSGTRAAGTIQEYELSGYTGVGSVKTSSNGTGSPMTAPSTSNLAFTGSPFLVGGVCAGEGTVPTLGAGTGFTAAGGDANSEHEYATSGITSPTNFPFTATGGSGTNYYSIAGAKFPTLTTQPITCTMDNSGTQVTVTLSGAGISPTTKACDGASSNFTCTSGTITATEPAAGANTRARFSSSSTTTTVTCSTTAWTFTNYYQLQNTYQATPNAQTTWDSGLTAPAVVGTVAGTASTTICSITLTGGGGAATCSGWGDYNRAAVIGGSTIAGAPANSQWERNGACSFSDTTGGNTNNCGFYKEWTNSFLYSVTGGGSPTAPTLSCNKLGATVTLALTLSAQSQYCDNAASATATDPTTGSTSSERFSSNAKSFSITAGGATDTFAYYHQYACTCSYSGTIASGGAPSFSRVSFGSANTATVLTTIAATLWADNSGAYTITKPTADFPSSTQRYETNTANGTISAAFTLAPVFYNQWLVTNPNSLSITPFQFGATGAAVTTNAWNDASQSVSVAATYTQSWTITYASWIYDVTASSIGIQLLGDQALSAITYNTNNPSAPFLTFTTGSTGTEKAFIPSAAGLTISGVTNAGTANTGYTFASSILTETGASPHELDFSSGSGTNPPPSGPSTSTGGGTTTAAGGGGPLVLPPTPRLNITSSSPEVISPNQSTTNLGILLIILIISSGVLLGQLQENKSDFRPPKVSGGNPFRFVEGRGGSPFAPPRRRKASWRKPR